MDFPPGKPIAVLSVLALLSGIVFALTPSDRPARQEVWTFDRNHAEIYRAAADEAGLDARVRLFSGRALDIALQAVFSGESGDATPDVVEIEVSSAGRYFRPATPDIALRPLDKYLKEADWKNRLITARANLWAKDGVTFGVPLDVHPVGLAVRSDLFAEVGLDPTNALTWPALHALCLDYQQRWHARGQQRYAFELSPTSADVVYMMLLQQGIDLSDAQGRPTYGDPRIAQTVAFYATLVAGPRRVAADTAADPGTLTRDLDAGRIAVLIMPDWRVIDLKQAAKTQAGHFRIIPLPIFSPGDTVTSTWGGTMLGIPRAAKTPAASWHLLETIALKRSARVLRVARTGVVAPIVDSVAVTKPDPFFGGQDVSALYNDLASRVPTRRLTPYSTLAVARLSLVVADAVELAEAGLSVDDIAVRIRPSLEAAHEDLSSIVDFFEKQ